MHRAWSAGDVLCGAVSSHSPPVSARDRALIGALCSGCPSDDTPCLPYSRSLTARAFGACADFTSGRHVARGCRAALGALARVEKERADSWRAKHRRSCTILWEGGRGCPRRRRPRARPRRPATEQSEGAHLGAPTSARRRRRGHPRPTDRDNFETAVKLKRQENRSF